jgi:ribosome biogenesis GTPase
MVSIEDGGVHVNGELLSRGVVTRIRGSIYVVSSGGGKVDCTVRGRFRIGDRPEELLPVVGDNVEFRVEKSPDDRGARGMIMSVLPRTSVFARSGPSGKMDHRVIGANLDQVIIVVSTKKPTLKTRLVDRMIVAAEAGGMEPVICVNKMDLVRDADRITRQMSPYEKIEYKVIYSSALRHTGLEGLRELMRFKRSMMVGPSGSGKTSLVAALQPDLKLATGSVSEKTGKGRHTTTHFELHELDFGGYIGDTPGIREFGVSGVEQKDLATFFRDFRPYLGSCRFSTCTHSHEPDCAVKQAVEEGALSTDRYESYLRILGSIGDRR